MTDDLHSFLSAINEITSIVGNSIWRNARQGDLPTLIYRTISTTHDHELSGKAAGHNQLLMQFDVLSRDDDECLAIIEALRQNLQGFTGRMGTTFVIACKCEGEGVSESIAPQDGSERWLYRRTVDYAFRTKESIP